MVKHNQQNLVFVTQHLLERIDPIHHHVALQNYLHKILGGSNVGSAHHQLHVHHQYYHHPFYRRFKEGQFFRSRLPHCLSVLIDWCLNFDSSSRPTAKQVQKNRRMMTDSR